jgi:hypothetical protein
MDRTSVEQGGLGVVLSLGEVVEETPPSTLMRLFLELPN